MKRKRFREEQIIEVSKESEAGVSAEGLKRWLRDALVEAVGQFDAPD